MRKPSPCFKFQNSKKKSTETQPNIYEHTSRVTHTTNDAHERSNFGGGEIGGGGETGGRREMVEDRLVEKLVETAPSGSVGTFIFLCFFLFRRYRWAR